MKVNKLFSYVVIVLCVGLLICIGAVFCNGGIRSGNTDPTALRILESTADETDRTAQIIEMLEDGVCYLGPGDFYIGNLQMPENSMLVGSGSSTRLFLREDIADGYALKLADYCTVKDLQIHGAAANVEVSENRGSRHGIVFEGNAASDSSDIPLLATIENCFIKNFTGSGIICRDTGYYSLASIDVTDCNILRCNAGINIAYFSEYHQFTNVNVSDCYYGCINNGGNNVFVNCDFGGNVLGFLIDNSQNQSPNNTHGSAIGCTFNHSNQNTGTGIKILNTRNGFVFSGCQIFYSKIDICDTEGITFDSCNFGKEEGIFIQNGGRILFDGCTFGTLPEITIHNNENVQFVNCFTRDGSTAITIESPTDD